jgi:hypothetical protein
LSGRHLGQNVGILPTRFLEKLYSVTSLLPISTPRRLPQNLLHQQGKQILTCSSQPARGRHELQQRNAQ